MLLGLFDLGANQHVEERFAFFSLSCRGQVLQAVFFFHCFVCIFIDEFFSSSNSESRLASNHICLTRMGLLRTEGCIHSSRKVQTASRFPNIGCVLNAQNISATSK